ncbi:MAG: hypothetical protein AAGD92_11630 [Pseudomonadota bacterium]
MTGALDVSDYIYPPKPRMAFRVGVTGHRSSRLAADQIARIEEQLRMTLSMLSAAVENGRELFAGVYADADPVLYFVSALADGADTLAANRALEKGWRLLAPLPFSIENYAKDFSDEDREAFDALLKKADSVAELDGARTGPATEERAYLQAGLVTVDQSDLVIAIWDGEEARGIGGTAMIKEEALSAGKHVIWIHAVADRPPVLIAPDNSETTLTDERLNEVVTAVIAPPPGEEIEHAFAGQGTHARAAYCEFAAERAHRINYGSFFQFWEKVFAGKWPFNTRLTTTDPVAEIMHARESTLAAKLQSSRHDQDVFNNLIIPRFAWADHLAVHYGNLYRSSYFFNYLFAAAAVFLALFDLVAGGFGFGSKTIWISVEVTLIVLILGVTIAGKRGRWHEKWIDYRQLTEELRQYRLYFLTLGRGLSEDMAKGEGGEAAGWVDWYFAATRREAGMTSGSFAQSDIRLIANIILNEEIRPQIAYHDRKAHTLHAMEHRLHHLGEYAFGATLIVCLAYLSLAFSAGKETEFQKWAYATKNDIKGAVTLLTGFLPSLGAAFFGIRVQGEFASTAERSHATAAQLKTIAAKFEQLASGDNPRLSVLRTRVEEAARAMLMENMDWRLLYISKPLNLPG